TKTIACNPRVTLAAKISGAGRVKKRRASDVTRIEAWRHCPNSAPILNDRDSPYRPNPSCAAARAAIFNLAFDGRFAGRADDAAIHWWKLGILHLPTPAAFGAGDLEVDQAASYRFSIIAVALSIAQRRQPQSALCMSPVRMNCSASQA